MGIFNVEGFLGGLEQLHLNFSDISARQDFQNPVFFMHELLIKELWYLYKTFKKVTRKSECIVF